MDKWNPMMIAGILGVYIGVIVLLGGLVALDGLKKVREKWEELPETVRIPYVFFGGILLLFISGILELSVWRIYRSPLTMALSIGIVEESLKLSPLLILLKRGEKSYLWKLTIGTAVVFAVFETLSYISAFAFTPTRNGTQMLLFGVRLVVVAFHVLWTAVPLSYLLYGKNREALAGWAFAVFAHSVYDYPVLAASAGENEGMIAAGVLLSVIAILSLKIAVDRALQTVRKEIISALP